MILSDNFERLCDDERKIIQSFIPLRVLRHTTKRAYKRYLRSLSPEAQMNELRIANGKGLCPIILGKHVFICYRAKPTEYISSRIFGDDHESFISLVNNISGATIDYIPQGLSKEDANFILASCDEISLQVYRSLYNTAEGDDENCRTIPFIHDLLKEYPDMMGKKFRMARCKSISLLHSAIAYDYYEVLRWNDKAPGKVMIMAARALDDVHTLRGINRVGVDMFDCLKSLPKMEAVEEKEFVNELREAMKAVRDVIGKKMPLR